MNNIENKRMDYIDYLKVLGLIGIIMAHTGCPDWVIMIISFNVPIMVLISSALGSYSINKYDNNFNGIIKYIISRIKRLIIPTYIFLLFFFVIKLILEGHPMPLNYYLSSFALTRYGMGYVWIILIYLYSAILIPVYRKLGYSFKSFILIIFIYIIYEILFHFQLGVSNKFILTTFYYIIPYGFLTYLGYCYPKYSDKIRKIILFVSGLLLFLLALLYRVKTGSFQYVFISKYPPRIYYLSYGIFISFLLLRIFNNFSYVNNKLNIIVGYISKHSLSIYLWHTLIIEIYNIFEISHAWYLYFFELFVVSIFIVFIVNKIFDLFEKKRKIKLLNYLR